MNRRIASSKLCLRIRCGLLKYATSIIEPKSHSSNLMIEPRFEAGRLLNERQTHYVQRQSRRHSLQS